MTILPRAELTLRTIDAASIAGGSDADVAGVSVGAGSGTIDLAVSSLVGTVTINIGLDRLLNSTSPVDNLLNSPDALARFRPGAVPSDPSPVATRGMTIRQGDPYTEVATRYAVGGTGAAAPGMRAEIALRAADAGLSARIDIATGTRGVDAVRDPAAAASLAVRIGAPAGTTAAGRGSDAGQPADTASAPGRTTTGGTTAGGAAADGTARIGAAADGKAAGAATPRAGIEIGTRAAMASAATAAGAAATAITVPGLVNILGGGVSVPADAPIGAILIYARGDGTTVAELRTATGFAGAQTTSALPLTGSPFLRSGDGHVLLGVFVRPDARPPPSPFTVAGLAGAAVAAGAGAAVAGDATAGKASAEGGVAPSPGPAGAAAAVPAAGSMADAPAAGPPPTDPTIPAGHPPPPADPSQSGGDWSHEAPAAARPYLHALWYDILALRFATAGVDLAARAPVLRDAVWATAMEHGPFADATATDVLSQLSRRIDLATAGDAAIVAALFAERARVTPGGDLVHYPAVLPFDRDRVIGRLADEASQAAGRFA